MEKIINYNNLRDFTYSNDLIVKHPIRGIVLDFFGLGGHEMFTDDSDKAKSFAEKGIIFLLPYYNPWSWMNKGTVEYVDEIVDVLIAYYKLPEDIAIVSTGGSMGGLSALVYTRYAKITPVACVANCPVCDLPYHYTERSDLPRTLYSAFYNYEGSMDEALKSNSPLHLVDSMPNISYYIFCCDEDKAVNKGFHSDKFVGQMKKSHQITYHIVSGRGHCDLPDDILKLYNDYIYGAFTDR